MSTFFRSAAMSLLSRTLQTLLSKYLSDVDVEGVNLPSLYSSDGHSGWGVRLRSVKLREGAKLFDLPGQPNGPKTTDPPSCEEHDHEIPETTSSPTDFRDESAYRPQLEPPGGSPIKHPRNVALLDEDDGEGASTYNSKDDRVDENIDETPTTKRSSWFSWWSSSKQEPGNLSQPDECEHELNPLEGYLDTSIKENHRLKHPMEEQNPVTQTLPGQKGADSKDDLPMILRIGKGGTIGTLDVRLVGSDIHVFVEDADLILEVVRLNPIETDDKEPEADSKKKKKPTKKLPESKTVGDRVLAENALARVLSLIPNLFLRDIRIRVIIRSEGIANSVDQVGENDTVIELAVELLSVTDGADFLARFRSEDDDLSSGEESDEEKEPILLNPVGVDPIDENHYLTKRIRTGRGADGGIVLRVFPPNNALGGFDTEKNSQWARSKFMSASEFTVLRCPGLDIQARIFMGTKAENDGLSGAWFADDYGEYDVDAMLFGIDYVAPGPKPPLPPMEHQQAIGHDEKIWTYEGATNYQVDDNGIRSSGVDSSFHRVARGLMPVRCDGEHLPCEQCGKCWFAAPGAAKCHRLDSAMPMGGLVLQVSMRDPLEVNVDRASLDVMSLLLCLFKSTPISQSDLRNELPRRHVSFGTLDDSVRSGVSLGSRNPRPSNENIDFGTTNNDDGAIDDSSSLASGISRKTSDSAGHASSVGDRRSYMNPGSSNSNNAAGETDVSEAFPAYMQPEKIQVMGLHIPEIRVRLHVMRSQASSDLGASFFYWDLSGRCLTADYQDLKADQKKFQDLRFDTGLLQLREYKGMKRNLLASFGLRQRVVEFDEVTVETLLTEAGGNMRPPWPSTAAALLDAQPPLETLGYEARDRHALQLRYVSVVESRMGVPEINSMVDIRVGAMSVDMPWAAKTYISEVIATTKASLFSQTGRVNHSEEQKIVIVAKDRLEYRLRLDGGQLGLDPLLNMQLPLTVLTGEKSSESGLFFESLLENVGLEFGNRSRPKISYERKLSLMRYADLPENVRLRILLFLKDLKPLELAMGVKPEENSFLRCRAINKKITKLAKRYSRYPSRAESVEAGSRREKILSQLLRLDDDALEDLCLQHERNQRKAARKTGR